MYGPTKRDEVAFLASITFPVCGGFLFPELLIRRRAAPQFAVMGMPKATVNK